MQKPTPALTATLFGGEAHGHTIQVPLTMEHTEVPHQEIWVTMVTGNPLLPGDSQHLLSLDVLRQAWSRWESYEQVTAIAPSQEGRVAYWCTRPLISRSPEFTDVVPMLIPRDSATVRRLRLINGNPGGLGPDRRAQWAAISGYLRDSVPAGAP